MFWYLWINLKIIGEPDIECLDQEIRVWVKTKRPFQGFTPWFDLLNQISAFRTNLCKGQSRWSSLFQRWLWNEKTKESSIRSRPGNVWNEKPQIGQFKITNLHYLFFTIPQYIVFTKCYFGGAFYFWIFNVLGRKFG